MIMLFVVEENDISNIRSKIKDHTSKNFFKRVILNISFN